MLIQNQSIADLISVATEKQEGATLRNIQAQLQGAIMQKEQRKEQKMAGGYASGALALLQSGVEKNILSKEEATPLMGAISQDPKIAYETVMKYFDIALQKEQNTIRRNEIANSIQQSRNFLDEIKLRSDLQLQRDLVTGLMFPKESDPWQQLMVELVREKINLPTAGNITVSKKDLGKQQYEKIKSGQALADTMQTQMPEVGTIDYDKIFKKIRESKIIADTIEAIYKEEAKKQK